MQDVCDTLVLVADKMKSRIAKLYQGLSQQSINQIEGNLEIMAAKAKDWEKEIKEFAEKDKVSTRDKVCESAEDPVEGYRYLLENQFE